MRGVARTKLTPDMLTLVGVALCLAGAVLVGFETRNEYFFFWLGGVLFVIGSIADILDGALARAAGKGTVFGAFLDSTFDRVGEAAILAAIGLSFMHDSNEVALMAAFAAVIGSFLVSYTRARAEALGLRGDVGFGSRVERVVLIGIGLFVAPWGWLQWPIYVLAALAWITVAQRILFVRRQLRELAETSDEPPLRGCLRTRPVLSPAYGCASDARRKESRCEVQHGSEPRWQPASARPRPFRPSRLPLR
jgi:CDP-diacylglycerol--glycerol-3-phosphate 3-phosphatidyltransferase